MDAKVTQKYLRVRRLPSEMQQKHPGYSRPDPLADFWDELPEAFANPSRAASDNFIPLSARALAGSMKASREHCQWRIKHWSARKTLFAQEHVRLPIVIFWRNGKALKV